MNSLIWELLYYQTAGGKIPFRDWFQKLKDSNAQIAVEARLARLQTSGHFGKCKPVGSGVYELKIDYGPGYRIYYAAADKQIVLLLFGGNKSTQTRDIQKAINYWSDYKRRTQ